MNRDIGLEQRDGHDVGRDPRAMTAQELERLGHRRLPPLKALRLRCLDCCGGSAREVRLCTAVDCPAWPFRTGRNPWSKPVSEARREHGRRLGHRRTAERDRAFADNGLSVASEPEGCDARTGSTDESCFVENASGQGDAK